MNSRKDDDTNLDFDTLMFDERIDNDPLFNELEPFEAEHIPALRDKLVHLSRFGNLLTLVLGERGSGKTYLLEQLLEVIKEESDVCFIQAQPLFTTDQLYQTIQSEFLTSTTSALDNEQFQSSLAELELPIINRLLIVDDADTLSIDVVRELCALSASEQDKDSPFVKVILFANHDLTISIETAARGVLAETGIYTIDLPGLSEEDARRWVEYTLLNEGYQPLTEDVDEIINLAGDNLTRLEEVGLDFIDSVPEDDDLEDDEEDEQGVSMMGYWFAGLTAIILIVLGGFFYQDELTEMLFPPEQEVAIKEEVLDVSSPIVEATPATSDVDQTEDPLSEIDTTTSKNQTLETSDLSETPAVSETPDQTAETTQSDNQPVKDNLTSESPVTSAKETQAPAEKSEVTDSVAIEQEPVAGSDSQLTKEPPVAPPSTEPQNTAVYTATEQALLDADRSSYVVQIVGLSNPDSVTRLLEANQELNLMAYRSLLNGKPWQVIVLGVFDNYADANAQRNGLPESLAINKPWIKSVAKVHDEIRRAVSDIE